MAAKLGKLHKQVIALFKQHPVGHRLTVMEMRAALGLKDGEQRQFERRLRQIRAAGYDFPWEGVTYWFNSFECNPVADTQEIGGTLRARILNAANGQCAMCGKNIKEDHVKLVVDHRIPRNWGGETEPSNLQGLCQTCNIQKRDYFATLPDDAMKACMKFELPVQRIGELLKYFKGKMVPRRLLEVAGEGQDEWTRRRRELNELGWKYARVHDPSEKGKYSIAFRLIESKPWPADIRAAIREHRRNVKKRRASKEIEPDE